MQRNDNIIFLYLQLVREKFQPSNCVQLYIEYEAMKIYKKLFLFSLIENLWGA